MDAAGYLADVERTPATLDALGDALERDALGLCDVPWRDRHEGPDSVLVLGMGSSAYASGVVAARRRAAGVLAVADLASTSLLPPPSERLLVVAVSASGSSAETVAAATPYAGKGRLVAVTEVLDSPLAAVADV